MNIQLTRKQATLIALFFLLPPVSYIFFSFTDVLMVAVILFILELITYLAVKTGRENFPWLITSVDCCPKIDIVTLDEFMAFGFDPEIGWERKPNSKKSEIGRDGKRTQFHINADGGRLNPGHEKLVRNAIALYGDSFGFSRQVNDNESLQWHLSKLFNVNVLNFAVGNYGFDQAILRFRRIRDRFPTKVTIFGLVPSTIVRIHDMWKHYNEFGNIYGFKPRFALGENGTLEFYANRLKDKNSIVNYTSFLPYIQKHDMFYKRKFLNEMIRFPYLFHVLAQPYRNFSLLYLVWLERLQSTPSSRKRPYPRPMKTIMRINMELRRALFAEKAPIALLKAITCQLSQECEICGTKPLLLWMPQKDDVQYIQKTGNNYYQHYLSWAENVLSVIDMTEVLLGEQNIDTFYCDDTSYGGHFTNEANHMTAKTVHEYLIYHNLI